VFFNLVRATAYPKKPGFNASDPLWSITPLVDYVSDGSLGTRHAFEWEREWRHPGDLEFSIGDIAFLFIPESEHVSAAAKLSAFYGDPANVPQMIDATWNDERLQAALASLPASGAE
jgi:hypothetical protein